MGYAVYSALDLFSRSRVTQSEPSNSPAAPSRAISLDRSPGIRGGAAAQLGGNTMKITDVACHILQCKVDKPFVSARVWVYGTRSTCLISTDEGTLGAA